MKFSVCIPTYEMKGKGVSFLDFSLSQLKKQTLQDFEVVVSDHSHDDAIKTLCEEEDSLNINYIRNTYKRGLSSANTNVAMKGAQGDIIKILFQDDYLCDPQGLEIIYNNFDDSVQWLVNGCVHTKDNTTFYNPIVPRYHPAIYLGENTISSPSVLSVRNKDILDFDESLLWLMDVEYYKRLYDKHGLPRIVDSPLVVNTMWDGQVSNTLANQQVRDEEKSYVVKKYEHLCDR